MLMLLPSQLVVLRNLPFYLVTVHNLFKFSLSFICSVFLGNIKDAFIKNPSLQNLLLDDFFKDAIHNCQVPCTASFLNIPLTANPKEGHFRKSQ